MNATKWGASSRRNGAATLWVPTTRRCEPWPLLAGRRTETWCQPAFDGRAELFVLWRPLADGWLVTASLSNTQAAETGRDSAETAAKGNEQALFEAELACIIDSGEVGPYPGVQYSLLSDEEQELEFQYRHHRVYAIGHGAAVDWDLKDGRVAAIRTEFLPRVEVPQVSADVGVGDRDVLDIRWLAEIEGDLAGRCDALGRFVSGYAAWVNVNADQVQGLIGDTRAPAERILERMHTAVARMGAGIDVLRRDPLVARAFGLANLAMERQMAQADKAAGRPRRDYRWRPFQLAFLLLALESSVNEDSAFRDTLDLIWFPTGGGKTEAYLGLMALVICWRRLKYPASSGGTSVLMRYTLRLLTKDQFRRAARLICALELLRRDRPELGAEPITLGLWVGGASSPNSFADAKEAVDQAIEEGSRAPSLLVLESCPWCGDPFDAGRSYDAGPQHFRFNCTNPACDFGAGSDAALPCNIVDAALYEAPPTLLLATIDKFARLAWEERSTAFFGRNGNRPPELIIQDELHLIAGALGSVAGLYEAGLETVLTRRGVHPKYVASTATIRMAREQVERLYGREGAVFPPPGLDCDDSYFARTVPTSERPGRLYVGYLAPARDRQHCLAPVAAALLAAPEVLFGDAGTDAQTLLDAWWTLLIYHGSLKGVGVSRNALQDIETFMARYQREEVERRNQAGPDATGQASAAGADWRRRAELAERLAQLTSHMSADENARTFDRLRLPRGAAGGPGPGARDQHGLRGARRRQALGDDRQRPAPDHGGVHPGQQPGRPRRCPRHRHRQLLPRPGPQPVPLRELPGLPRVLLPLRRAHQRHPLHLSGPPAGPACRPGHRRAPRRRPSDGERACRGLRPGRPGHGGTHRGAEAALSQGRPGARRGYRRPHRQPRRPVGRCRPALSGPTRAPGLQGWG